MTLTDYKKKADEIFMKVRIKFRKYGPVRFIGHLDVMRFFQKALRRAEIDVKYTGGFSPHQIMSFAAPLGVGLESNGEYMDIECNSVTSSRDMIERLNSVSVPGIEVVSARQLPDWAGNAMASVAAAEYTVRFREGREPKFDWTHAFGSFLSQDKIMVTKETKKGLQEVDIRQGIYEMSSAPSSDCPAIHLLVDASSAGNIKPVKVIEAFCDAFGEKLQENALFITREEIYTNVGTSEERRLIPLNEVGTDIEESTDMYDNINGDRNIKTANREGMEDGL